MQPHALGLGVRHEACYKALHVEHVPYCCGCVGSLLGHASPYRSGTLSFNKASCPHL